MPERTSATSPASTSQTETATGAAPISECDARILAFERTWWKHVGLKEQAIRDEFGFTAARYYQVLGALLDSPAALAHDPMLIRRLQRVRDTRTAARSARLLPPGDSSHHE